jgi:hypothetical protein
MAGGGNEFRTPNQKPKKMKIQSEIKIIKKHKGDGSYHQSKTWLASWEENGVCYVDTIPANSSPTLATLRRRAPLWEGAGHQIAMHFGLKRSEIA